MADWYPNSRDEQLHMVKTWNSVFATRGQEWGIPQNHITQLVNDAQAAEAILDKVKSGERTAAEVVQCNMIFKDMETEARFVKKHYLLMPPLTPADFPLLLLPLPDEIHTSVGPPSGQPSLTVTYPGGPHLLMIHLASLTGTEPVSSYGTHYSRGDYGYALYRGIMPQGGATLEQAAGVKHYLMKEPLSGDVPKSLRLFGLGVCAMRKLHTTTLWSFAYSKTPSYPAQPDSPSPAGKKNRWILIPVNQV